MRILELVPGEWIQDGAGNGVRQWTIDLDAIVYARNLGFGPNEMWRISFSNGVDLPLTKAGFERVTLAWRSR